MSTWAAPLIGIPWQPGAKGPQSFDCWGLVQYVFLTQFSIVLPDYAGDVLSIKDAANSNGWRRVGTISQGNDLIVMRNPQGERHVGMMIPANGRYGVLHADGHLKRGKPVGQVAFSTLHELTECGCSEFEFWRNVQAAE